MSIQTFLRCNSNQITKKFALAIGVVALTTSSIAYAASDWSQKPSWSENQPSYSSLQKRSGMKSDGYYDISPYSPGSNNLALDVGQVFLLGDLGNRYPDNIGFQVHYTYGVSDIFGFDASIGHSSHKDGEYSMTTLLTGMRTNLSWFDRIIPYVVFGLGFYRPDHRISKTENVSAVLFGLHLGPGVDLQLTRNLFFGAGLTFHDIFGTTKQGPNGESIDMDGTFTSFLLHAGVTF